MRKSVCFILAVIIWLSVVCAYAVTAEMRTEKIYTPNNRLFDVPVYFNTSKPLSAATFSVRYNPDKAVFRKAVSNVSESTVKCSDKNGVVKAVFICPNGVKLNKNSLLLVFRFKAVNSGNSEIKITADDCVDSDVKNFTPPKAVSCIVETGGKSSGYYSRKNRSYMIKSDEKADDDDIGENMPDGIIDDNKNSKSSGLLSQMDVTGNGGNPSLLIIICVMILAVIITAGVIFNQNRLERKREDKKDETDS